MHNKFTILLSIPFIMTKYAENELDVILVLKIGAAIKEAAFYQHE